ncbi:hypothetical protein P175DRAFT_0527266 [Aspergillus ochraceoroseus IBT 24754]|uniref:Uncharacterized protein n=2 Tax=Aspergillus subgen. Nidulantes TaxID=2720870 RepID=A0A0F8WEX5_9EURO|nr:uncharacterized protein P175DRAFT_0527266 [Aspergillus ochraceoroseus IBT 24754]KKK16430.1 hypothetical protein ARAM_002460 [Aspergillus rambellii]PTU23813.1 hypothetical protein P175DRAFT_0527266 [Aspergillus ochraceoroseus IBT 24754]
MLSRSLRVRSIASGLSSSSSSSSSSSHSRNLSSSQPPSTFKHVFARYKLFAGPFAKVFLGAVFTYQVIRWTWLKLEMDETKVHRNQEVIVLEKEARELTGLQQK